MGNGPGQSLGSHFELIDLGFHHLSPPKKERKKERLLERKTKMETTCKGHGVREAIFLFVCLLS